MVGLSYLHNVVTLKYKEAACIGCGRCEEVCPHQVFTVNNKKAELIKRDACMECGACALNCPSKAISVESGVGCASGMINEWLREHRLTAISSGSCCD